MASEGPDRHDLRVREGQHDVKRFPLLRYYLWTSLAVIALVTLVVAGVLVKRAERDFVKRSTARGALEAGHVVHMFYMELWAPRQKLDPDLTLQDLIDPQALALFAKHATFGLNVVSLDLLNLDGTVLWRSGPSPLTDLPIDIDSLASVVHQGTFSSQLTGGSPVAVPEAEERHINLVRTLYPIRDVPLDSAQEGRIVGILEISQDVTAELRGARRDSLLFAALSSTATGAVLFSLLFLIVFRADRVIGRGRRRLLEQQASLQASEDRFRGLVEQAADAFYVIDLEGRLVDVNKTACEVLAYSREELRSLSVTDIDAGYDAARVAESLEPGVPITLEGTHRRKDGRKFPVEVRVGLIELDGQEHMFALARDITERMRAQAALRRSEERFRTVFESASVGMAIIDREGRCLQSNLSLQQILGYSEDELRNLPFAVFTDPKGLPENLRLFRELLSGKRDNFAMDKRYILRDGSHRWGHITVFSIPDATDEFRCVAMVEDITERTQLESAIRNASRLASLGELSAGVAHEVSNPLTAVLGFSQLLLNRGLPPEATADAETIYSEAARASKILQNLLSFARKRELEKRDQSVVPVLERALELASYSIRSKQIEFVTDWSPDLPSTMLDEEQMVEVLLNIITNAEQAILAVKGRGRVTVSCRSAEDKIRISVSDDGPGIAPDDLSKLFDPFFTTKPPGEGTGLGLSICYGVVSQHGGELWVESLPGEGATFHMDLPITASDAFGAPARTEAEPQDAVVPVLSGRGNRMEA